MTLTYAQSVDGSICRARGTGLAISSAGTMAMTHELRARHAAIVVGVGTVLADNPSLTTRLAEGRDPWPVVIDSNLRTPVDCKLFTDERCKTRPLLLCSDGGDGGDGPALAARRAALEAAGAQVVGCKSDAQGRVDIGDALDKLGARFDSVMVEGGAHVISSVLGLAGPRVSCVIVTVAPMFVGGYSSLQRPIPEHLSRAWRVHSCDVVDGDVVLALVPHISEQLT